MKNAGAFPTPEILTKKLKGRPSHLHIPPAHQVTLMCTSFSEASLFHFCVLSLDFLGLVFPLGHLCVF